VATGTAGTGSGGAMNGTSVTDTGTSRMKGNPWCDALERCWSTARGLLGADGAVLANKVAATVQGSGVSIFDCDEIRREVNGVLEAHGKIAPPSCTERTSVVRSSDSFEPMTYAAQPKLHPPGPCVAPFDDALARARKAHDPSTYAFDLFEAEAPDLDGDGLDDVLIADRGYCGSRGCTPFWAYVRRGSCGHYVGAVDGTGLASLDHRSRGWLDVRSIVREAGWEHWVIFELRFAGRAYAPFRWRDCHRWPERGTKPAPEEGAAYCTPWES
jgi:hypothetical protein